jgi:hypothetical protein
MQHDRIAQTHVDIVASNAEKSPQFLADNRTLRQPSLGLCHDDVGIAVFFQTLDITLNGVTDICHRFVTRSSLGNTAGQSRAFGNKNGVFIRFNREATGNATADALTSIGFVPRIRDHRVLISAWQTRSVDARGEDMVLSRIDTHHHLFPPKYLATIEQHSVKAEGGGIAFPEWSPAASLEIMDRYGIQTAILSVSSPGVYFGGAKLARICNDYGAELVRNYPERFGYFASVPLPATGDAVAEAAYAYDTLNCDGIVLLGDVGDRFLGDPEFEELMQELNRRNAVVFVHPNVHSTSRQLGLKFPEALFEFLADTTRAVLNLTLSGTLERNPNIRGSSRTPAAPFHLTPGAGPWQTATRLSRRMRRRGSWRICGNCISTRRCHPLLTP